MTTARPIPRRGLRRTEAATYVGLSPTKFDELVKAGRLPDGFTIDGCRLWDVIDLDFAFDMLKGGTPRRAPAFDRI